MKTLFATEIAEKVYDLAIEINTALRPDILKALRSAYDKMVSSQAKEFLRILLENAAVSKETGLPLCQDTGMVVVYLELGRDVCIKGDVNKEISSAVKKAYKDASFRPSIVKDPVYRGKSGFCPPIIHIEYTNKKDTYLTVLAKGFGSENKSQLKMLLPTSSEDEIANAVVRVISEAGSSACPPFIVGVGIGGTSDKAMFLAKKALALPVFGKYKGAFPLLRDKIIKLANKTGIGVLGLGKGPTVLGVNILSYPTHIAGLPVGVNIGCHSTRSKRIRIS